MIDAYEFSRGIKVLLLAEATPARRATMQQIRCIALDNCAVEIYGAPLSILRTMATMIKTHLEQVHKVQQITTTISYHTSGIVIRWDSVPQAAPIPPVTVLFRRPFRHFRTVPRPDITRQKVEGSEPQDLTTTNHLALFRGKNSKSMDTRKPGPRTFVDATAPHEPHNPTPGFFIHPRKGKVLTSPTWGSETTDEYMEWVKCTRDNCLQAIDRTHPNQRAINWTHVRELASEFHLNHFSSTADPIEFDATGKLVEGQHRLRAALEAGVEPIFPWWYNMPSVDAVRGRALIRRSHDALSMELDLENTKAKRVTEIANALHMAILDVNQAPGPARVKELYLAHKISFDWFVSSCPNAQAIHAPLAAAFVYAYRIDPRRVNEIGSYYYDKVGMHGDPANTLAKHIKIDRTIQSRKDAFYCTLFAIKAQIENRKIKQLRQSPEILEWFDSAPTALAKRPKR